MRARDRIRKAVVAGIVIAFFALVKPQETPPMAITAALAIGFYAAASEDFEPLQGLGEKERKRGRPDPEKISAEEIRRWAAENFKEKREKGLGSCSYQGPGEEKSLATHFLHLPV